MFFVAPLPRFKKAPTIPEIIPNDNEVTKTLIRARSLLEKSGWIKRYFEMDGAYCAIGALNKTAYGNPVAYLSRYNSEAGQQARKFLKQSLPFGWNEISSFNDAWWRRKSRVLKLYDDAIAESRHAQRK